MSSKPYLCRVSLGNSSCLELPVQRTGFLRSLRSIPHMTPTLLANKKQEEPVSSISSEPVPSTVGLYSSLPRRKPGIVQWRGLHPREPWSFEVTSHKFSDSTSACNQRPVPSPWVTIETRKAPHPAHFPSPRRTLVTIRGLSAIGIVTWPFVESKPLWFPPKSDTAAMGADRTTEPEGP